MKIELIPVRVQQHAPSPFLFSVTTQLSQPLVACRCSLLILPILPVFIADFHMTAWCCALVCGSYDELVHISKNDAVWTAELSGFGFNVQTPGLQELMQNTNAENWALCLDEFKVCVQYVCMCAYTNFDLAKLFHMHTKFITNEFLFITPYHFDRDTCHNRIVLSRLANKIRQPLVWT